MPSGPPLPHPYSRGPSSFWFPYKTIPLPLSWYRIFISVTQHLPYTFYFAKGPGLT